MAQIIEMEPFRAARPARDPRPSGGAEILFFLGVRYERMPETPAPVERPARKAKRARKRRA